MNEMKITKAVSIFTHIDSPDYTDEEKALAIHIVLEMPTHNGITKDQILNVTKWLWNLEWEAKEEA